MTRDQLLERIDETQLVNLFDLLGRLAGSPAFDGHAFGLYLIDEFGQEAVIKAMEAEGLLDRDGAVPA